MSTNEKTNEDRIKARTALMRRHGLEVDEKNPHKVIIRLDGVIDKKTDKQAVIDWVIGEIDRRIITQEFCNARGPVKDGLTRVTINQFVERPGDATWITQETPNQVYMDLREKYVEAGFKWALKAALGEDTGNAYDGAIPSEDDPTQVNDDNLFSLI